MKEPVVYGPSPTSFLLLLEFTEFTAVRPVSWKASSVEKLGNKTHT